MLYTGSWMVAKLAIISFQENGAGFEIAFSEMPVLSRMLNFFKHLIFFSLESGNNQLPR